MEAIVRDDLIPLTTKDGILLGRGTCEQRDEWSVSVPLLQSLNEMGEDGEGKKQEPEATRNGSGLVEMKGY